MRPKQAASSPAGGRVLFGRSLVVLGAAMLRRSSK